MKLKNQILNYFVVPSCPPRVFKAPVTVSSDVASIILGDEYGTSKNKSKMLHVCFDLDSKIIYLPNKHLFNEGKANDLLLAAKYYIAKEFGEYKFVNPIEGSPFSSLRIRNINNFKYVCESIKDHFGTSTFENLTVVEANLSRMPSTVKILPSVYKNNKNFVGGLIGTDFANEINFYDEIDLNGNKRKNDILLLTQKTPFILIDISPVVEANITEKEWAILSGYRDYLLSNGVDKENEKRTLSFAPLYAAKRFLHMGWTFEEVCSVLLDCCGDFGSLMLGASSLLSVCEEIKNEENDPISSCYYYAGKINDKFPLKIGNKNLSFDVLNIRYFNRKTKDAIIETPYYVSGKSFKRIFNLDIEPCVLKLDFIRKEIDVKSSNRLFIDFKKTNMLGKLDKIIKKEHGIDVKRYNSDKRSRSIGFSNKDFCNIRKISDFNYAKKHIERMCNERGMEFKDIDVVIGPIEKIFGRGVQGGFMSEKDFKKSKMKEPYEIEKGLFIKPPIIFVNSDTMPSYVEQTETLIHEYSHKLYSISHPLHEHLYNKDPNLSKKDPIRYWDLYLSDLDERIAHKEEIKFELQSGKSVDEIIRDKIGGAIIESDYKKSYFIALKFKGLINDAIEELNEGVIYEKQSI